MNNPWRIPPNTPPSIPHDYTRNAIDEYVAELPERERKPAYERLIAFMRWLNANYKVDHTK